MPATASKPAPAPIPRGRPHLAKVAALGAMAMVVTVLMPVATSAAATDPGLGTAESFGVLGSSTVTNTGPTVVNGDLGVSPGLAVTGFTRSDGGPGIVNGSIHAGDAVAADARAATRIADGALAAQGCDQDLTGRDLGGLTLTAGVYCFSSSAQLTGTLTLDAAGDPDAVFVFRTGSTLTTASASSVQFTDGLSSCSVFWQVGSSATLGTGTDFVGTVIAQEAVTANTGADVVGRLLALGSAVTLDTNVITAPVCAAAVDETPVDETPVDETPVDETPVDETPVDETPVDETPLDESPVESPSGDTPVDTTGGPAGPELTTGVPTAPAGPAAPTGPTGPPMLPATGANDATYAWLAALSVLLGAAMVTGSKRLAATHAVDLGSR